MRCPKCGKQAIANTNKKNPKAPDWKCSDPDCKWKKINGEWVESEFVTGVWNNDNPEAKFESELEEDKEDEKWEKIREEKKENIAWLNAKNNAVMLIAYHPNFKDLNSQAEIEAMIEQWTGFFYNFRNGE